MASGRNSCKAILSKVKKMLHKTGKIERMMITFRNLYNNKKRYNDG